MFKILGIHCTTELNKASQAIQSPRTVPFFLLVSLLDGYSFPNVLVKGIVAFKPGLEKLSVLPVLDRFLSLKTDFVLNRLQKNRSIKVRFFSSNSQ